MFNKRAGMFYRGIKATRRSRVAFGLDKTRPASLLNDFKNILQKACLLGVRTKVLIVRGIH